MVYCNRNKIYDHHRKTLISDRPEEVVRQKVIHFLVNCLQFPKDLIVVEKQLKDLNSSGRPCPKNRRIDILCFAMHQKMMHPLLLIECKKDKIKSSDYEQLEGYNAFIQAKFIALVSTSDQFIGYFDAEQKKYCYISGLIDYPSLVNQAFLKA